MQTEFKQIQLSALLRQTTQSAHTQTEGESFIKKLFTGTCTEHEYYHYLWALHGIYTVLEESMIQNKDHQFIKPIYIEKLFRRVSLENDLKQFQIFKTQIPENLIEAVEAYKAHLYTISENNPYLLVAHAYVRYLGDLSGGQMLAKALSRQFTNPNALTFYSFPEVNIAEMKTIYRDGLDQIGLQSEEISRKICDEATQAFQWNGFIFKALSINSQTV